MTISIEQLISPTGRAVYRLRNEGLTYAQVAARFKDAPEVQWGSPVHMYPGKASAIYRRVVKRLQQEGLLK